MISPLEKYQQALATGNYIADYQQQSIVKKLDEIYTVWCAEHLLTKKSFLNRFKKNILVKGLYLWGSVGAGKTWLMDLFYDCIPDNVKIRLHFHRFMQYVHTELKKAQGYPDPLKLVAKRLAQQAKLIFLDEFLVNDITDAMLLSNLLAAVFNEGITLMATSNVPPSGLYRNGLQRDRFLPAIDLLNQHMQVLQAAVQTDYRLRTLEEAGVYFYPLNQQAEEQLMKHYLHLAHNGGTAGESLVVASRSIPTRWCAAEVVWFDFEQLCQVPRSQIDYVEIARIYHTVIVSAIPRILPQQDNIILYLIHLVDVFYDAKVKLIISAAVPIEQIYTQGRYAFEFERTQSRLREMQSKEYWQCEHIG